jgi:hypothetical protein
VPGGVKMRSPPDESLLRSDGVIHAVFGARGRTAVTRFGHRWDHGGRRCRLIRGELAASGGDVDSLSSQEADVIGSAASRCPTVSKAACNVIFEGTNGEGRRAMAPLPQTNDSVVCERWWHAVCTSRRLGLTRRALPVGARRIGLLTRTPKSPPPPSWA